jgi:riboflavin biosynthesis pyrimidine reductase
MSEVDDIAELQDFYGDPPDGVRANMIFSLDGAASLHGRAGPLSGPLDQQLLLALRGYADVVLVGAGTARAENYGPVRLTHEPPPIAVVSQSGKLPPSLFAEPGQPPMLITSAAAAAGQRFEADVVIAGEDTVDMATAISALHSRGMRRVLCEGGPTLLDELVMRGLIDEMCVTIAPKLAGTGQSATSTGLPQLRVPRELSLHHVLAHQGYLFVKYGQPSSALM